MDRKYRRMIVIIIAAILLYGIIQSLLYILMALVPIIFLVLALKLFQSQAKKIGMGWLIPSILKPTRRELKKFLRWAWHKVWD